MEKIINKKWSSKIQKIRTAVLSGIAAAIISVPATYADDTEIFFGKDGVGSESNPNILFVLDNSGSMRTSDTPGTTRIEQVKSAMSTLLDQSSDFNVGVVLSATRLAIWKRILHPIALKMAAPIN